MKPIKFALLILIAACLLHPGRAAAEENNAIYLLAGLDGKMLTNQDANNYFNLPGGQLGPQGYPSFIGHLGFQFRRWVALEASANLGPVRQNDITYNNGFFNTRHIVTSWTVNTYSLTPAITWAGDGWVNLLGVRLGQANLVGKVNDDAFGINGSYDQSAQTYDIGVVLRSSMIAVDHISIGLEAGYDWTMFNNITNKNGQGSYDPVHSPERNVSGVGHGGDQTTLDFSGGHVAVVIGLWSNPPVSSEHGSASE